MSLRQKQSDQVLGNMLPLTSKLSLDVFLNNYCEVTTGQDKTKIDISLFKKIAF